MFDLEQSIADWRKQMLTAGIKTPVPLEELEIHLRDEIERQMKLGLNERENFNAAVLQIGQAGILKNEFKKVGGTFQERIKNFILTLSGVPNPQLATNMNTSNSNLEPRWATYLKATTFVFPAVFVWLFSVVFLFPKLNEICQGLGTRPFNNENFSQAPAVFKIFAGGTDLLVHLTRYSLVIGGAIVLFFILLEWRFSNWPRYRRATIGIGVFLLNAIVLISITTMIISALIAIGNHAHGR